MKKLTTEKLKELITEWLSVADTEKKLAGYYTQDLEYDELNDLATELRLKQNSTVAEIDSHFYKIFSDGSRWKREEKNKLDDGWKDYMMNCSYKNGQRFEHPYWNTDFAGSANMGLVEKFFNNPKEAERCIFRLFIPKNDCLSNNFRLEVITTPDDAEVVGWTVVVD